MLLLLSNQNMFIKKYKHKELILFLLPDIFQRMLQKSFTQLNRYNRLSFGGSHCKSRPKLERPLSSKKWIHLVLKSERAKGKWSFLTYRNQQLVKQIIADKARQYGVQIRDLANAGNHLHLMVKFSNRNLFQNFLRAVTGILARAITGARKGNPIGKFWTGIPFTRVLKSNFEELALKIYFEGNRIEVKFGKKAREQHQNNFRDWLKTKSTG
jgi:REP element-mobilizing transposase RayT